MRVCQKLEGGSKRAVEVLGRAPAVSDLFRQGDLPLLQPVDFILIGGDQRRAVGGDDALQKLADLAPDFLDLRPGRRGFPLLGAGPVLPDCPEAFHGQEEQAGRGAQFQQQFPELGFHAFPADGFAILDAIPGDAEVIGIFGAAAMRPAGGHGLAAIGAGDKTPKRKVILDVLPCRGFGVALQPVLYRPPCGEAYQRLMLAGMKPDIPFLHVDIPGIERPSQHVVDPLEMHFAAFAPGKRRVRFQEPLDLNGRLEPARCEAFQRLLQDGRHRLIPHKHLVVARLVVAIAKRRRKHPITVHHPRAHPVPDLFGVLLPLVLRYAGQQVFDKLAVGVLAELDAGAFQLAARFTDGGAKLDMRLQPPRQTADVVDQDDNLFPFLFFEKLQHGLHTGTVDHAAGNALIAEDLDNLIGFMPGIFPAARFLRPQAVAFPHLFRAGDAAVNDGFLFFLHCTQSLLFSASGSESRTARPHCKLCAAPSLCTCCTGWIPKAISTKLSMMDHTVWINSIFSSSLKSNWST